MNLETIGMPLKNDAMKSYMQDVGKLPLLSRQEETELAARIAEGDVKARHILITCNLRLVVKIAHDFKSFGLPLIDLIAEGNVGLMRAAEKFDPGKGAKFSSYAAWWIKQSIRRAITNQGRTIRIPVQSASKLSKIKNARNLLAEELGRDPSSAEIARELNFSERTVKVLQRTATSSFSLHELLKQGELGKFEDVVLHDSSEVPDEVVAEAETYESLLSMVEQLDERERTIILRRFGLDGGRPWTLDQLSELIGLTRERVRQIQYAALDKLRDLLDEKRAGVPTPIQSNNQ